MSHRNLIPTRRVPIGQDVEGNEIHLDVRGLSLSDVTAIMRDDGGAAFMERIYSGAILSKMTSGDFEAVVVDMLDSLPDVVARVIARAAGIPEEWALLRDVALGTSLELLETIATLTFTSERVAKKVMEVVRKYAAESQSPLPTSVSGSGG